MSNDLVAPEQLAGFPGAPFSDGAVDAAVAELRSIAGWHIAPERTETVTVDGDGSMQLLVPSLYVTAVSAVRNVYATDSPSDITGFRWSPAGVIWCGTWMPCGFRSVEVDLTHGYEECPADLLPAIVSIIRASTTDPTVAQQQAGPFAQTAVNLSTLASWLDRGAVSAIARYKLPPRP